TQSEESRIALLGLLPGCGDAPALATLKTAAVGADTRVRDAVVRALADWPNASAWDALTDIYRQPATESLSGLAHGYWRATGDTLPFDGQWKEAAWTIMKTFRAQQRKEGKGPYSFERRTQVPYETVALGGFGNPARPVGMIFSMFRPSDDACI